MKDYTMFHPKSPAFQLWLQRRGVPIQAAVRAAYLNRGLSDADLIRIGKDESGTFGEQAAHALENAFDWQDTREGKVYWRELTDKLRAQPR